MKNIFLDTNVVLDLVLSNRPNHKFTKLLVEKLESYNIFISEDMITTIYYISKNNKKEILEFLNIIIDEWNVVCFNKIVMKKGVKFALKNNKDLEDTLQCFCANMNSCEILLTNDKKFVKCCDDIEIITTEQFLKG